MKNIKDTDGEEPKEEPTEERTPEWKDAKNSFHRKYTGYRTRTI